VVLSPAHLTLTAITAAAKLRLTSNRRNRRLVGL
jgi:hypothetical protein